MVARLIPDELAAAGAEHEACRLALGEEKSRNAYWVIVQPNAVTNV